MAEERHQTVHVREIALRSPDPNRLADLLVNVLGFTKLRHDEGDGIAILTDGYLQLGIRSTDAGDGGTTTAIDHIGIEVDDVDETCAGLFSQGWTEAPNTQPAT